jgi:hypothetical protein
MANVKDSQSRKWQITINNPIDKGFTHDVIAERLQQFKGIVYYCMADEISETGTPHTHMFCAFRSPVRFRTIKHKFQTAHIENAYGSSAQNRAYILKEGEQYADKAETSIEGTFNEWGELPTDEMGQGFRSDLELMYELIQNGATVREVIEVNPDFIRYFNLIEKVIQMRLEDENKDEFRKLTVTYIHGATETGKTRYVMEREGYTSVYRVTEYKHPFDGYEGQGVIPFEEFSSSLKIQKMLNYLDGYPLKLPCRYADKQALYDTVYLISNLPLEMQYANENEEVRNAFLRRINYIMEFTAKGEYTITERGESNGKSDNAYSQGSL